MADVKPHIMVVESRFYQDIADELRKAVTGVLDEAGATYEHFTVPGAFEVPAAIAIAVRSLQHDTARRRFDGYIALGCVLRGETTHYDYVCQESARALQDLAVRFSLALGYGILTCENHAQALARARHDQKDRGGHAARACLAMIELKRKFHMFPR